MKTFIIGLLLLVSIISGCASTNSNKGYYHCFYMILFDVCQESPIIRKTNPPSFWGWM